MTAKCEILESASRMLYDVNYGLHTNEAHTGVIKIGGNKYRLSFVISHNAYMAIVATTGLYPGTPPDDICATLFGIPVSVMNNVPPVSLVFSPIYELEEKEKA
jgi:hypothetical protein